MTTTYILDLDRPSTSPLAREASQMVDWGPGRPAVLRVGMAIRVHTIKAADVVNLKEEHAERLMHVLRVLHTLGRDRPFDLGTYIDAPDGPQEMCGTAACACGWAMLDPWFQEHMPRYPDHDLARLHKIIADCRGVDHVATYGDLSEWITGSDKLADYLFLASSYPSGSSRSAAVVAERIRLILNLAGYTGQHTLEF